MFSKWKIPEGSALKHCLRVSELAESPFAVVCAHATVSGSIKRYALDHHVDAYFVDAASSILKGFHNPVCPFHILGKDVQCQRMFSFFNNIQYSFYFVIFERNNRKKWTKKFFADNFFVCFYRIDDSWSIAQGITFSVTTKDYSGTIFISCLSTIIKGWSADEVRIFCVFLWALANLSNEFCL